jgi:hypothetical protein
MEPSHEEVFALERVELSDDSDDGFEYNALALDDDAGGKFQGGADDFDDALDADEDLETALASIKAASAAPLPPHQGDPSIKTHPRTAVRPSVVDDFIRNFLIARQMKRTLDEFNTEWYEKQAKGQLKEEDIGVVPDIYMRNLELDEQVKTYQLEVSYAFCQFSFSFYFALLLLSSHRQSILVLALALFAVATTYAAPAAATAARRLLSIRRS